MTKDSAPTSDDGAVRPVARGRPSKQDALRLRKRIQAVALGYFRRCGYAGSTIDGIAREAGVSRTTIYALFGDKNTLFTEMVKSAIPTDGIDTRVAFDDRPPGIVLREAIVELNASYARRSGMELMRLFIAEADRFPDLFGEVRASLVLTLSGLVDYLSRLRTAGRFLLDDPVRAGLLFNMLALGSLKPFFIPRDRLTDDERIGHLDVALLIFMRGCFAPADWPTTDQG